MYRVLSDNKDEKPLGKLIPAIGVIFLFFFVVSVAGLFYFSYHDNSLPLSYKDPTPIETWSMTTPEGNVLTVGDSYLSDGSEKGTFTMISTLPVKIPDDSCFCFIIGGDCSVYVDGELRKDFYAARDMNIPGGNVKRFYMRAPLSPSDSGAEVMLIRYNAYRPGFIFQDTMVANETGFFKYMTSHYGLSFILEVILLIFSFVIVIISLFMLFQYKRQIAMLYGSMSILVVSGWLITNSYMYPFVFGHYHLDGIMNYMFCLFMPFCVIFYLDMLQHGRYRTIMKILLVVATIHLVVWPILHFTCLLPFPDALIYLNSTIGVEALVVSGVMIYDLIRGYIKDYKYTAIGFAGFFVCGLGEIVVLNAKLPVNGDILMLTGLAILLTLMTAQQISDLRKMREEGQKAINLSEAKTRFLASMSHEIRTPINAILGMNEMILRENSDPVIGEYAESVKSSGQMLLMLVNDVLDFSKIEAGKMEINPAEFTLSSLLHNVMPMLRERADEKHLALNINIQDEVPDGLFSDEFRIRQILINLINNAIKYTDTGSVTLTLGGKYTGNDAYLLAINVRDTGRGIKEDEQKHLFEAFSRADMKKNRNIEGTGLGLAIVGNIVDSMGGRITVESIYGEGSEFKVQLPVGVKDKTPLTEDFDKKAGTPVSAGSESDYFAPEAAVLAVDDNSSNLRIVSLFLKRVGIVPELCDSGSSAIELCRTRHYDLILLDHMMPDPDGIKTLETIKNDISSLNSKTPAIVLTANAIAGSEKLYTEAGFDAYLTKPLDADLLEQTVKKYLPEEKILPPKNSVPKSAHEKSQSISYESDVMVFEPVSARTATDTMPEADKAHNSQFFDPLVFRKKLEGIEGLDYKSALGYAGGREDLLKETVEIIASECDEKAAHMRSCVTSEDWEGYGLAAHSLKGLMASIGLKKLSKRAKDHEFAAKDHDTGFILSDYEAFLDEYREVCSRLK
jgi:signal transduction histidine kinase/DNA-binding response OmpR family regulator/HPt (histidine-containing phosphotransfer) domain-containing protein